MTRTRKTPAVRIDEIITAALALAEKSNYRMLTRQEIGDKAGVHQSLVFHYLGTKPNLERAIMRAALKRENLRVIFQGLSVKDKALAKITPELKQKAIQHCLG